MARQNIGIGIGAVLALLFVALIAVLGMPLFQAIGYGIFVQSPAFLWWTAIGGIAVGALFYKGHPNAAMAVGVVAVIMMLFVGPLMSGVYAQEDILQNQDFEQRAELNDSSTEHVRILPQNVADRYAESANQLPKYRTGDSDIAYEDGSYTWSYPVVPDRFFVAWQGNQWGAYYVNMEQTSRSVTTSETTMKNGKGQLFIDSFNWQTTANRMDVEHKPETTFVFEDEGETHIARSYVTHEWKWKWTPIPQPYAVPKYGGTQVMNPDGTIEDYSPKEVANSETFAGQNTYPYDLARFRMTSMQLQHGLMNKWFIGEDVPQIADTGGFSDNQQPFTVPMNGANGSAPDLQYFIAATPSGSGDGIYQIYQIDGQTGQIEYVQFNSTQAGPQKAAGYTRSQNRAPNWAANNEGGSTQITEPIPLVIDGDLYWHMRVTPTDGARVSYTTFVNADTGNVYRADNTQEIMTFIESGGAADFENDSGDGDAQGPEDTDPTDGTFTVAVVEDGEVVETFTVEDDQQVVISADNSTDNSTATASG